MEVIRLLGVIRQSKTHEDAISDASQKKAIKAAVEAKNQQNPNVRYEIVGWAIDLGVSGYSKSPWERPSLGDWLNNRTHEYDGLISWKLDRVTRSIMDFARLINWLDEHKKTYMATADPIDLSTPIGRAVAQILVILAELELNSTQSRNLDTRKTLNEAGRWTGGHVPYARKPVRTDDGWKLVIDPDPAKDFARIVEMVSSGVSLSRIAEQLNKDGVPTSRDNQDKNKSRKTKKREWSGPVLSKLLRSRHLIGQREINGIILRDEKGEPVIYCEPLMTVREWQLLQEKLNTYTQDRSKNHRGSSLLRKVGKCGVCKNNLHITMTGAKGNTARTARYRCASYTLSGLGHLMDKCGNPSVRADELDKVIEESILGSVGTLPRMEKVFVPGEDHTEEREKVDDAIRSLKKERDRGLIIDEEEYFTRLEALMGRRNSLLSAPDRPAGYEMKPTGQTVAEHWNSLDRQGRNAFLQEMRVQIFYDKSDGYLNWHVELGDLEHLERAAQGVADA